MIAAFRQAVRIGDRVVETLGIHDWYVDPRAGERGLGSRVLEPLLEADSRLVVGGTQAALRRMAALGFAVAGASERWVRRLPARLGRTPGIARAAAVWLRPRSVRAPRGARAIAVAGVAGELDALQRGRVAYGTLPLWSTPRLQWLATAHPAAGHFVPLYFARRGELLGWALLRVYAADAGGTGAELVEIMNPRADPELYVWQVAEAAGLAAAFGAARIGAATACPALATALRANRFAAAGTLPIHTWRLPELPAPRLLGSNTRDTALLPYAARWWGDRDGA
jgi:hypothetical protein